MKLLISAFSCGAGLGSEPGVGWNFAVAMAQHHDVTVLTTHEFEEQNSAVLARMPDLNLNVECWDLPWGVSRLRRAGIGMQIYYYLWQVFGVRRSQNYTSGRDLILLNISRLSACGVPACCAT